MSSMTPPLHTGTKRQAEEGDHPLTLGDFEDRFSLDKKGRLKFDGALVETTVGLKRRDFNLALAAAVIAGLNMLASWFNARLNATRPAAPPPQVTCPAPVVNFSPPVK